MNYKELRIGNIVNVSGKPETVTGVLQFGCYFHLLYYPFNLSMIKPIELTEEWLFKFGFEEVECICEKGFSNGIMKVFINSLNQINFCLFDFGDWYMHTTKVHEFQNLYFALTKEELKLKQ